MALGLLKFAAFLLHLLFMDLCVNKWKSGERAEEEEAMSTRARIAVQATKAPPRHGCDKEMAKDKKTEVQGNRSVVAEKGPSRGQSRRDRKIALQQDVDRLRKKLRHEENCRRALVRAFTRPLGALPRLPPYLPSHTLELLAEVAVLEEEVVRLEEQVMKFWQGLYEEAIHISSSKKNKKTGSSLYPDRYWIRHPKKFQQSELSATLVNPKASAIKKHSSLFWWISDVEQMHNDKWTLKKLNSSLVPEDKRGKENQSSRNFSKNNNLSPMKDILKIIMQEEQADAESERTVVDKERPEMDLCCAPNEASLDESSGANKLSEAILKCMMNIFLRMCSPKNMQEELETSLSVLRSNESSKDTVSLDPYSICAEFGERDIGPYKHLRAVEVSSTNGNLLSCSTFLNRRLKILLEKLASVDLSGLSHQQKLAFWINIYNSCMMNAFLEQGIPTNPQTIVALMSKVMMNVGGHLLNAMMIEHFILRSAYHMKHTKHASPRGSKSDDTAIRSMFGLEWPEPLVTFALSCGSWSSPAVRVYTAPLVEKELEKAKRDYLQAAVGICTPSKLAIPKLLHWYLPDFAKDVESLVDWICLQLPSELRTEAVKCLELGRRGPISQLVQFLPYDFRFRDRATRGAVLAMCKVKH